MLYILTFIVIILNLLFYKSKKILILDFIYLFIMLGLSYGSYDTLIFIDRYNHPEIYKDFTEPVFNMIVNIFHNFGFNYRQFMIILASIELIMIFRFIRKHTKIPGCVLCLFIIFPMLEMFEQLRFFLAFTIVLTIGIDALIEKKSFYRSKFIISIIIASLIHSATIFCLLFLICDIFNEKMIKKIVAIGIITILIFGIFPSVLEVVNMIIGDNKMEILTRIQKGQIGQFGCSMLTACISIEYIIMYLYSKKRKNKFSISDEDEKYLNLIYKINIMNLITIPLIYLFSVAFMRMAVFSIILNYIGFSKIIISMNKKYDSNKSIPVLLILLIFISTIFFGFSNHTQIAFELKIRPFFEENDFLNIFKN